MINMHVKPNRQVHVAVSGGVDSMAALDFLSRKHEVTACFFNHGTASSQDGFHVVYDFVVQLCAEGRKCRINTAHIDDFRPQKNTESLEEYWRNARYNWLNDFDEQVVTAHHLDDCVETWIWSSLNGNPTLPHTYIKNVIRPFLTTTKQDFIEWAERNSVPYVEDETNRDTNFTRNYIRHELMPHALHINPGIHKVIAKKIRSQ